MISLWLIIERIPTFTGMSVYDGFSDAQLAAKLKTGDRRAFTEIYTRYWGVLFRHARKMLGDEEEAVDILQDIFAMVWNRAQDLDIRISLKPYLYSSVRNRILNKIRHDKVHAGYLDTLTEALEKGALVTDEQVRYRELAKQVEKEVASLPAKMREVFELSRDQGMSHSQIALELGISEETVKKQIHRAIKTLRAKLGTAVFLQFF